MFVLPFSLTLCSHSCSPIYTAVLISHKKVWMPKLILSKCIIYMQTWHFLYTHQFLNERDSMQIAKALLQVEMVRKVELFLYNQWSTIIKWKKKGYNLYTLTLYMYCQQSGSKKYFIGLQDYHTHVVYSSTLYVGMRQVQNGRLHLRYGSKPVTASAKCDKILTDKIALLFYCKNAPRFYSVYSFQKRVLIAHSKGEKQTQKF